MPQEVWKFVTQFQTSNPPPKTATCRVTSTVRAWNTGLTSNITIANTGTTAIDGWSLVFTLPDGQTVTSGWNADYSPASGRVTARNASHNATIAPGASVDIGFQAAHNGNSAPLSFYTLNGTALHRHGKRTQVTRWFGRRQRIRESRRLFGQPGNQGEGGAVGQEAGVTRVPVTESPDFLT